MDVDQAADGKFQPSNLSIVYPYPTFRGGDGLLMWKKIQNQTVKPKHRSSRELDLEIGILAISIKNKKAVFTPFFLFFFENINSSFQDEFLPAWWFLYPSIQKTIVSATSYHFAFR